MKTEPTSPYVLVMDPRETTNGVPMAEEHIAAWRDELSRRIDNIESGKVKMLSHDEVFAHVQAELEILR